MTERERLETIRSTLATVLNTATSERLDLTQLLDALRGLLQNCDAAIEGIDRGTR